MNHLYESKQPDKLVLLLGIFGLALLMTELFLVPGGTNPSVGVDVVVNLSEDSVVESKGVDSLNLENEREQQSADL